MTNVSLKDKVVFITGASRGIGREIALRCSAAGARVVIAAKTDQPHPTLSGTIHSVAAEITAAGGIAMPLAVDIRNEEMVYASVKQVTDAWGGIDCLVNNASAINLSPTADMPMKRYDLIFAVNVRGTFLCSQACLPWLKKSTNAHILNLSPPLNMKPKWFKSHLAYTMSKYGMSMCTLGLAEEFKSDNIAVNSLWPQTTIATAAIEVNFPKKILLASRKPSIMADAAYEILQTKSSELTGQFLIDEAFLKTKGVVDFDHYAVQPGTPLFKDLYLD